ncbi:MAG: ribonuclease III domain-containing protein [Bacteroidales bacterium]|nr:ribonuclease III domain-containing protein [Bacteroidales bacterium]
MILNLLDRMKLPFRRNKEFLSALYDILGFYPHDIEIYRIAFSHKSVAYQQQNESHKDRRSHSRDRKGRNSQPNKPINNERLEYLGDAILEGVVSDILFRHFKNEREGFLTSTRAKIVQRESLNRLATQMGLEKLIHVSQTTRMSHTNIGGNAFEALIGAIYLDRGYRHCHWFVSNRIIGRYIDLDTVAQKEVNFKSKLLEWSQKNRLQLEIRDLDESENVKLFHCELFVEGISVGKGQGRSKKEAHQHGAKDALIRLNGNRGFYRSLFDSKEKRTAMEAVENFTLPRLADLGIKETERKTQQAKPKNNPVKKTSGKVNVSAEDAYDTAYDHTQRFDIIEQTSDLRLANDFATAPMMPEEENKPKRKQTRNPKRKAMTVDEALQETAETKEEGKAEKKASTKKASEKKAAEKKSNPRAKAKKKEEAKSEGTAKANSEATGNEAPKAEDANVQVGSTDTNAAEATPEKPKRKPRRKKTETPETGEDTNSKEDSVNTEKAGDNAPQGESKAAKAEAKNTEAEANNAETEANNAETEARANHAEAEANNAKAEAGANHAEAEATKVSKAKPRRRAASRRPGASEEKPQTQEKKEDHVD